MGFRQTNGVSTPVRLRRIYIKQQEIGTKTTVEERGLERKKEDVQTPYSEVSSNLSKDGMRVGETDLRDSGEEIQREREK